MLIEPRAGLQPHDFIGRRPKEQNGRQIADAQHHVASLHVVVAFEDRLRIIEMDTITLESGPTRVFFEVRFSNWDPNDDGTLLKAWLVHLGENGYEASLAGKLTPPEIPCDEGSDEARACREVFGGNCEIGGEPCVDDTDCPFSPFDSCIGASCGGNYGGGAGILCDWMFILSERNDYVFKQVADLPAADNSTLAPRAASVVLGAGVAPPDPFPEGGVYAATVVLDVPESAWGTIDIDMLEPPFTYLVDGDNQFMPLVGVQSGHVVIPGGACCFDLDGEPGCVDARITECNTMPGPTVFSPNIFCGDLPFACPGDCNENQILDADDIASGASKDCEGNGLPDECEVPSDCNANGVRDACELARNPFADQNRNGTPDDCETNVAMVPVAATGPHKINGQTITVEPGQTVVLEINLANWDIDQSGTQLRSWQVCVDETGVTGGAQGVLTPLTQACDVDADCADVFGSFCTDSGQRCSADGDCPLAPDETCDSRSRCGAPIGQANLCTSGFIDNFRSDYIFAGVQSLGATGFGWGDCRYAATSIAISIPDTGSPAYAGTVVLNVPLDAEGTFIVGFNAVTGLTLLRDEDNEPISSLVTIPARITISTDPLLRVSKNRYLTLTEMGSLWRPQALRVTFKDLPAPYDDRIGTTMWVGKPFPVSENGNRADPQVGIDNFLAARLQCDPFFTDWAQLGVVEVFHHDIIPGGIYEVEVFDEGDPPTAATDTPGPVTFTTARWGDLVGQFDATTGTWTGPDGTVGITSDVVAMIETFQSLPGFTRKVHIDVSPATPDSAVTILDIVFVIDAFRGFEYPFESGSVPCS